MVVGEIAERVDFLVIGGGPGGYTAALDAARAGRRVTLVDSRGSDGLGGVCVRVGCIPSKALIEYSQSVHGQAEWGERDVVNEVPPLEGGLAGFQTWKNSMISGLNSGVHELLKAAGVEIRRGWFRFTRANQGALITDPDAPPTHLRFDSAVIATGSRPTEIPFLPIDGERILSSTELLELDELPESLAIVGGGYIGIEIGTALAKLGVQVTILEAADKLLPLLPRAAGAAVAKRLGELGVHVLTRTTVTGDDGSYLIVEGVDGEQHIAVDRIAVAVGRTPNTDDLGLPALGATPDERGLLKTGPDMLLTRAVAAIGDTAPGPALAHKASAEAHVAVASLTGTSAVFDHRAIPAVVFSDPEVAHTGLTVEEAAAAGHRSQQASFPVAASGRARTMGRTDGLAEWVYDADTGVVLGALLVGPHATELIAQATLAVEMGAHLEDISGTIHAHPTMSEILQEAALVGLGRPVHIPAAQSSSRHSGAMTVGGAFPGGAE